MDLGKSIDEKREQILKAADKDGAWKVRLFGSVARGVTLLIIGSSVFLYGCKPAEQDLFEKCGYEIQDPNTVRSWTPLKFLSMLKTSTHKQPYLVLWPHIDNWITLQDVRQLAMVLDSNEPCLAVVSSLDNYHPTVMSTEGIEAAQLIKGYITGTYPFVGSTPQRRADLVKEVKEWVRKNKIVTGK